MKIKKTALIISAAIAFSIVFSIFFKWIQTNDPFKAETAMYGIIIFFNLIITGWFGFYILKKFSKKSTKKTRRQIVPAFLLFVVVTLGISLIFVSVGVYLFYLNQDLDTSNFWEHLFKYELSSALKQFAIWILIGSVFFFYIIWRKAIERELQLREENLKYKYQNLKSQVNPHFLFNSLNTLSELVYHDAKQSDNYIQNLSDIYRYILENEETDLIDLEKEIEFVKQYFSIQQERDRDKISLEIDIPETKGIRIIPVSLQILVENALKHNSNSLEKPLTIKVFMNNDCIVVTNPIQKRNILENTTKTGLSNLKNRVKIIMGTDLTIGNKNNLFSVQLPIQTLS